MNYTVDGKLRQQERKRHVHKCSLQHIVSVNNAESASVAAAAETTVIRNNVLIVLDVLKAVVQSI